MMMIMMKTKYFSHKRLKNYVGLQACHPRTQAATCLQHDFFVEQLLELQYKKNIGKELPWKGLENKYNCKDFMMAISIKLLYSANL